jgi:hypothetical protein
MTEREQIALRPPRHRLPRRAIGYGTARGALWWTWLAGPVLLPFAPGILTPFAAGQGARVARARRPRVAPIRAGEAPLSRW